MVRDEARLRSLVVKRLKAAGPSARICFDDATEVVVFGSMSVGLDRPDSDIDVLCVGGRADNIKTESLDLIAVSKWMTEDNAWLQSELAFHVAKYGVWIKGSPSWKTDARIGSRAIAEKRRRISAFLKSLPSAWSTLEECFREKYSVKLRRETQRLLLLEKGVPVPPTRVLDCSWSDVTLLPQQIFQRLRELNTQNQGEFLTDLLSRVDAHFQGQRVSF